MSDCTFVEFEEKREDGTRRVRCSQCGHLTGYTAQPLERIRSGCTASGLPDVGRELAKLVRELGIKLSCKACVELAYKMRAWGVDGCREHRAEIVQEVSSRVGDVSWWKRFVAAGTALLTFRINPLDPIGSLVDEAIRRASAAGSSPPASP